MGAMSAYMASTGKRIATELHNLVGKRVEVLLVDGRKYRGILLGFDHPELNLLLSEAEVGEGEKIPRVIVTGRIVAEIRAYELSLFDAKEFAEYLIRQLGLRRDAVRVYEDANVVMVYNNVRVTPDGVEGAGTLAAKVNYVFKEYMERKKRGERLA
jgi:small nuclear ribonucleoprotein (snRNP)-like protein